MPGIQCNVMHECLESVRGVYRKPVEGKQQWSEGEGPGKVEDESYISILRSQIMLRGRAARNKVQMSLVSR